MQDKSAAHLSDPTLASSSGPAALTRALHRRVPSLSNYSATSISKHYQINKQILTAFEAHFEAKMYTVAYAIGLQFVETALLEIPKHGYFYSPRHERERMESSLEAVRVTNLLQQIQYNLGDVYSEDMERVQRLHNLAVQQVEQASEDQYESQRARTEQELRSSTSNLAEWVVLDPFLECQESLSSLLCPTPSNKVPSPETIPVLPGMQTQRIASRDLLDRDAPVETVPSKEYSERRDEAPQPMLPEADLLGLNPPSHVCSQRNVPNVDNHDETSSFRPPEGIVSSQSWGCPPPLVAQENSAIHSSNRLPPRTQRRPRPEAPAEDWMMVQHKDSTSVDSQSSSYAREGSFKNLVSQKSHRHIDACEDIMLERALFISGLEVVEASSLDSTAAVTGKTEGATSARPLTIRISSSSRLEFGTLSALYHDDFDHLVKTRRIRITTVATYQGRVPESTNGCTVIAPLLCMHHLLNDDGLPDTGVPDSGICQVIDQETPVILGDLRRQLGLADHAFLIPSDVHDYLIENGQLHQSQFIDVKGGDMMQDAHLENFVSSLANPKFPKLAATLFFHEHVVCILKLQRSDAMFWYDVIDSLPLSDTLRFSNESQEEFQNRFGVLSGDPRLDEVSLPFSIRLRCIDEEALQACLRWYACSKFSDENVRYIDQYEFDENQSSFDPRVFQAFLWGYPQL